MTVLSETFSGVLDASSDDTAVLRPRLVVRQLRDAVPPRAGQQPAAALSDLG